MSVPKSSSRIHTGAKTKAVTVTAAHPSRDSSKQKKGKKKKNLRKWIIRKRTVEVFILSCMDFRLCFKQRHCIRKHFNAIEADLLSLAGGAYALCKPKGVSKKRLKHWKAVRTVFANDLALAINKHKVRRLILCTHECCGKCANDGCRFKNFKEELSFHRKTLKKAKKWVMSRFPCLKVIPCFVYFDKQGLVQFEQFN